MSSSMIADALHAFLAAHIRDGARGVPQNRCFFRLDGFDEVTYTALLDQLRADGTTLGNQPVVVRTTGPLSSHEDFALKPHKTATWHRNHVPNGHALILIFNTFTSDAQSLKDIFPITETRLAREGLEHLIAVAFAHGYSLTPAQMQALVAFIGRFRQHVVEPQLRALADFLKEVNSLLTDGHLETLETALAEALPALGLFRCRALARDLNTTRGDRLLYDLYNAARLGDDLLEERRQNNYLDRLEDAQFDDEREFGGLSPDEKREALRGFLTQVGGDRRALQLDWREVSPVLQNTTRKSPKERLQQLAEAIQQALAKRQEQPTDLPDYGQEVFNDLQAGREPNVPTLDRLTTEYRDALGKGLTRQLRRLAGIKPQQTPDFIAGLTVLSLELLSTCQEELEPGWVLRVRPAPGQFDAVSADLAEALLAFRVLHGGIEGVIPALDWQLDELWDAATRHAVLGAEASDEEALTEKKVTTTSIRFRLTLCDAEGTETGPPADLQWDYLSDSPAASTLANVRALTEQTAQRAFVPIYKGCQPQREVSDFDLYQPRAAFGRWYDTPTSLAMDFTAIVSRRPGARKEAVSAVANAIDTLAQCFAEFIARAETQGLFCAGLDELWDAYEALLRTAAERLTNDQEVTYGFRVLNQAWMIGTESFDEWAVMPLLHPLKLLWWHNRACHCNALIAALLAHDSTVSIVDETRFRREFPQDASSAGFPVVLGLAGRDRNYFVPLDEAAGYELYRPVTVAAAALGLDTDLVSAQEGVTAAQRAARHLAQVVEDYIETYPFVEKGIEICLVECRNGALPGQLVEQLDAIQQRRGWKVRVSIVVQTTDRGVPIFRRVSEWLAAHEEYQERLEETYFPRVTFQVLETTTVDELLDHIQGKDLVILADVLSERGQSIEGILSDAADDVTRAQFMPSYRSRQTPFHHGDLDRRQLLHASRQPAIVRRFYNAQYAAVQRRTVPTEATVHFYESNSLHDWAQLLEKLHQTFNWVICYDTAVDRFLLEHTFPGTVQVIRYSLGLGVKHRHNLTVSSAAGTRKAVIRRLKGRLQEILPTTSDDFRDKVAQRLVAEANDISGDIVLRAAGPGAFLNELIGLVLTRHLTARRYLEAHPGALTAWIYLDDFSHWFSGKYPDLVFVAVPSKGDSRLPLYIDVIEAKCIANESFVREAEDAERQVAQGLSRLAQAWMPRPTQGIGNLDAPYWYDQLNRAAVANLSIEGEQESVWQALRQSVEDGSFDLEISGHAWTFCHDGQGSVPSGRSDLDGESALTGIEAVDGRLFYHRFARAGLLQALRGLVEETWHIDVPAGTWEVMPVAVLPTTTDARQEPASTDVIGKGLPPSALASRTMSAEELPSIPTMECDHEWRAQRARNLGRALSQYHISTHPIDPNLADVGPSVVRFKVDLKSGEKLSRLQSIAQDLARELTVERVPLIANIPGTRYVGIDLPRPERVQVPLLPALEQLPQASSGALPFLVGQTPNGRTVIRDLAQLPHLLVAGTTGSGKTMFLYTLLLSLLYRRDIKNLSFVLIDPKQTDFVFFEGLPFLSDSKVFIDPEAAIAHLEHLMTSELPHRTTVLREARCRDIHDYNIAHPHVPMYPIVVVIDEYADLLDVMGKSARDGFEKGLRRLAQQARNRGIHLVIATQRPSADIVTTSLKTNLPARIAFHLPSWHDSRTILDQPGAETLLGKGDMLFTADGQIERLQGFYLSTAQLENFLGRFDPSLSTSPH